MDILYYLNCNGIIVGEDRFQKESKIKDYWDVDAQISLIIEVQKILKGNKATILPRIESTIGKEVETFIVQTRKLSRLVSLLEEKSYKSDFDNNILNEASNVLIRAKKSINSLNEQEYLELIMRSMNNYEICLGRVDEGNLKREEMTINIRTIRYLSYNMVENDCYSYIKRLKKRGYKDSIEYIIKTFVDKTDLDEKSNRYINILASYPAESTKTLLKINYDTIFSSFGINNYYLSGKNNLNKF